MDGSGKSVPRPIFGSIIDKKKSWLDDGVPFTPPDDSGFLRLHYKKLDDKAESSAFLPAGAGKNLSPENVSHGLSASNLRRDSTLQLEVNTGQFTVEDIPQSSKASLLSVDAPFDSTRKRHSRDLGKKSPEILVEVPVSNAGSVSHESNRGSERVNSNIASKLDSQFFQSLGKNYPVKGNSKPDFENVATPPNSSEQNKNNLVGTALVTPQLKLPNPVDLFKMGQEKKFSDYFFTKGMFSNASNSTVGLVSDEKAVSKNLSAVDKQLDTIDSGGARNIQMDFGMDEGIKLPKQKAKPKMREMNFWAPQSM